MHILIILTDSLSPASSKFCLTTQSHKITFGNKLVKMDYASTLNQSIQVADFF